MDTLSKQHRSWNMSRIQSRDTGPECSVRSILHGLGFRFRKSSGTRLPGKPDIVLTRHRTVVLVHGCFWHRHKGCRMAYTPKSRVAFWQRKFEANVRRDRKVRRLLRQAGWRIMTVWECELGDIERLTRRLQREMCVESDLSGRHQAVGRI